MISKCKIKKLIRYFRKANLYYIKLYEVKNGISLPDIIQKDIIQYIYPEKYKVIKGQKTYDLTDVKTQTKNIELKSTIGDGSSHFTVNQKNCDEIIYFKIDYKKSIIDIFNLNYSKVQEINMLVQAGKLDFDLSNYIDNADEKKFKF